MQFDKWYSALKRKNAVGSHDHKLCMRWLAAIDIAPSYESLEYSGVFENLDSKMAAALIDICYGEFGRKITLLEKQLAKTGQCLGGRQVLWLIVNTKYRVPKNEAAEIVRKKIMDITLKMTTWELSWTIGMS